MIQNLLVFIETLLLLYVEEFQVEPFPINIMSGKNAPPHVPQRTFAVFQQPGHCNKIIF